jgi:hypothetical protein
MKYRKEIIKIPPKIIVGIVTTIMIVFILLIVIAKFSQRPKDVGYSTELNAVKITKPQNRGSIYINDTLVINSASELLNKPAGFDDWMSHGPIIDFDTIPYAYTLGDLNTPYTLSKRKNNDTIVINKNGDTLLFILYRFTDK